MSKWSLDLVTRLAKADIRLHNVDKLEDDMAIIFVVNHFTRLETLLLPYVIYQETGKEVMSLAASELFQGRLGQFLRAIHAVSTEDPDRDKLIVHSLLKGENPWMIFPEGAMIKDKKVVDAEGDFEVYSSRGRRPPHTGAAVLALRAEYFRRQLARLGGENANGRFGAMLEQFDLSSLENTQEKRTVIVPANITYYPIRAKENLLLRMASRYSADLSKRAVEELSVEGTFLAEDTDIDITLGDPIDVGEYLQGAGGQDLTNQAPEAMPDLELNPASEFNEAARRLMHRYMQAIYNLTTVNYDHLFATVVRHQREKRFTAQSYRSRIFLSAHDLKHFGKYRMHRLLSTCYWDILSDEFNHRFQDFLALCLREGVLRKENGHYVRNAGFLPKLADFHTVRREALSEVIANEVEPLSDLTRIIERQARLPDWLLRRRVRKVVRAEDQRLFEEDYAKFYDVRLSKSPEVGRPFLLRPWRIRGGIVLSHGYMAAPLEIRAMAEYFVRHGYAVYGIRLKGHGTSPEDLAQSTWEQWYNSLNRGYAVLRTLTDNIVLAGFSTGGCIALMGGARKGAQVSAIVSISAPLQLRNYSARLAPGVVAVNSLLKRIGRPRSGWEYVENVPENAHINYSKNPLTGIRELVEVMAQMELILKDIPSPTLVIQGSKDQVVNPISAQEIFEKVAAENKELTVFERDRHGIVNGEGSEAIFDRVLQFLDRVQVQRSLKAARPEDQTHPSAPVTETSWRPWRPASSPPVSESSNE
jgi:esterase/lipase/1-acyl-sn-glycerol-3-phosphate acyltransferase